MISQKSKSRRAQKDKEIRKDFTKKKNIRKNNWPLNRIKTEKPILEQVKDTHGDNVKDNNGGIKCKEIGVKTKWKKVGKRTLEQGDGILPFSKKLKESKLEKQEKNVSIINRIAKTTATKNKI